MNVSVIIPAYNEEGVIGACLESLARQTYKNMEVIVVDDGSTDNTGRIVRNIKNHISKIKIFAQAHLGAGPARNLGSSKAKGEILVFVDADMTFEKDFIEKLVGPIEKSKTRGTFPLDEEVANWDSWWARMWNIEMSGSNNRSRLAVGQQLEAMVFRAILKSEFDKVGGFDKVGYNDDWTLSRKLGYKATGVKGAVVFHKNPASFVEVWQQAKWVGRREYKLGGWGKMVALIRSSLPVSLAVASYKGISLYGLRYIGFKIIYDLAIFCSLLTYPLRRSHAK